MNTVSRFAFRGTEKSHATFLATFVLAVLLVQCDNPGPGSIEPASPICSGNVCMHFPNGAESFRNGDTIHITIGSKTGFTGLCDAVCEISFNGGEDFHLIDAEIQPEYACTVAVWKIPDSMPVLDPINYTVIRKATVSDSCVMRVREYNGDDYDESDATFRILK